MDGTNSYLYTANNPINLIDPLGLWCTPWIRDYSSGGAFWVDTTNRGEAQWRRAYHWQVAQTLPLGIGEAASFWVRWNFSYNQEQKQLIPFIRFCIEWDECENKIDSYTETEYRDGKKRWREVVLDTMILPWDESPEGMI